MIKATVIAHSVSPAGIQIFSIGVTAHRFILAEINTHRKLSRSYRSSRAVPSARLIAEVETCPAMPVFWGANQPGMQAAQELDDTICVPGRIWTPRELAREEWKEAAIDAARRAKKMADAGLHKQIANRVLEPFLWVHGIVTATDWDNFFGLRLHKAAQPEFRALADAMWLAMKESPSRYCEPGANWHLPYFEPEDWEAVEDYAERTGQYEKYMMDEGTYSGSWGKDLAIKMSVGRCAWSSYNSFETGKRRTIEEDLATYAKLNIPGTENYDPAQPIHASPAEHQATPDEPLLTFYEGPSAYKISINRSVGFNHPEQHGNFVGWRQYRKMLPGESCAPLPEEFKT